jgi:hypothetical protein
MEGVELLGRSRSAARNPAENIFAERRRRTRVAVRWACQLIDARGDIVLSATENLSSEGFYCLASGNFVLGDLLVCSLYLPKRDAGGSGNLPILQCTARVVHVESQGEVQGVGFAFEDYSLHRAGAGTTLTARNSRKHSQELSLQQS